MSTLATKLHNCGRDGLSELLHHARLSAARLSGSRGGCPGRCGALQGSRRPQHYPPRLTADSICSRTTAMHSTRCPFLCGKLSSLGEISFSTTRARYQLRGTFWLAVILCLRYPDDDQSSNEICMRITSISPICDSWMSLTLIFRGIGD